MDASPFSRRCEASKQPIRQHIIDVTTCRPLDSDTAFALSVAGTRVIYYAKYYPLTCACLVLAALAALAYALFVCVSTGKCAPTSGPCSKNRIAFSKVHLDEPDDDDEESAVVAANRSHR